MQRRDFLKGLTAGLGAAAVGGILSPAQARSAGNRRSGSPPGKLAGYQLKSPVDAIFNSQKVRNGVAIGGIGAGSAELRPDGIFYNWQIYNNLPLGTGKLFQFNPDSMLFFVLRYQIEGEEPRLKALLINNEDDLGAINTRSQYHYTYIFPWLSPVEKIESVVQFPFVRLKYLDEAMPVDVELEVFNPLIPNDLKNSSLPLMFFRFKVTSKIDRPVTVTLAANYRTGAGYDHPDKVYTSALAKGDHYVLHTGGVDGIPATASSYGTQTLASLAEDTTWRLGWGHTHLHYEQFLRQAELANIDMTYPFHGQGGANHLDPLKNKFVALEHCHSTLAVTRQLNGGEGFEHEFVHSWHFPNLYNTGQDRLEGHYYSNFFNSSAAVAEYGIAQRKELRGQSRAFVEDFFAATLDPVILNQINSQLNTLVTSSWLTRAGEFGIVEGMNCEDSCCGLATIDVGVYATPLIVSLFPDLQKASMRLHRDLQQPDGRVAHSYAKDFNHHPAVVKDLTNRLDVAMQYASLALRDFMWTQDEAYLKEMWPSIKMAMNYMLKRDRDGDQMPDMEGIMCSYDNFPMYGLASYIQSQWLYALAQARVAARVMGEPEAEASYAGIFERGKHALDAQLWNGHYFRLYKNTATAAGVGPGVPAVDEGCLTDQIVGQWLSHLSGLGYFTDPQKVRSALSAILQRSFTPGIGLRNCSWPGDAFLHESPYDIWVDQANTPWTGVELAFASFLIYEGLVEEGTKVIHEVDQRYRRARLYWNHQECGGHYYRALSAWTILNAFLGLTIQLDQLGFHPKISGDSFKLFFAHNGATAHFSKRGKSVRLEVRSGTIKVRRIILGHSCQLRRDASVKIPGDSPLPSPDLSWSDAALTISFPEPVILKSGDILEIG
jgi:hypothetical protein